MIFDYFNKCGNAEPWFTVHQVNWNEKSLINLKICAMLEARIIKSICGRKFVLSGKTVLFYLILLFFLKETLGNRSSCRLSDDPLYRARSSALLKTFIMYIWCQTTCFTRLYTSGLSRCCLQSSLLFSPIILFVFIESPHPQSQTTCSFTFFLSTCALQSK